MTVKNKNKPVKKAILKSPVKKAIKKEVKKEIKAKKIPESMSLKKQSPARKPIAIKKPTPIRKPATIKRSTSVKRQIVNGLLDRESNAPIVKIKVIGIGGGGNNAISRMSDDFERGVEFVALNTDMQDLSRTKAKYKINIGRSLTRGMGAGMNPEIGKQAAEESKQEIADAIQGSDLVFLTAGMGGGTGTGATPVVADIAHDAGALTVAVITKPFAFEGTQRARLAEEGIAKLRSKVDALIVIPNDKIFGIIGNDTPIIKAFQKIDEVLKHTVQGISELISSAGLVNVDFADVRAVLQGAGIAIVGVGQATGADRAIKAATQAINSPLLERSIDGARGVLFGISGGADLKMTEVNDAAKIITESIDAGAKIIFGAYFDRALIKDNKGAIKINLIATGFDGYVSDKDHVPTINIRREASEKPKIEETKETKEIKEPKEDRISEEKIIPMQIAEQNTTYGIAPDAGDDMYDIPSFFRRKKK